MLRARALSHDSSEREWEWQREKVSETILFIQQHSKIFVVGVGAWEFVQQRRLYGTIVECCWFGAIFQRVRKRQAVAGISNCSLRKAFWLNWTHLISLRLSLLRIFIIFHDITRTLNLCIHREREHLLRTCETAKHASRNTQVEKPSYNCTR